MNTAERFKHLSDKYYYDKPAVFGKYGKLKFIEDLEHIEGPLAGKPLKMDKWQIEDIIKPIFGLKQFKGGPRLINQVFIFLPRGNAKTTLCAAFELAFLLNDAEPGAQIYNCAGNDEQSNLLFRITKAMAENHPLFTKICKTYQNSIVYKDRFIKKITSKSSTKHGFNSLGIIYDEIHVAPNSELYDVLRTSMGKRTQPMMISITTAGTDKNSICYHIYDHSKKVLNGILEDDRFWCVLYEADAEDDPFEESTWSKSNPLYASSKVLREYIKGEAKRAEQDVRFENTFRNLHLNQWTASEVKWINDDVWAAGSGKAEIESPYYMGLDLSSTSDITALSLLHVGEYKNIETFYWIPEKAARYYEKKFNVPYSKWAKGNLTIVPGNTIDFAAIEKKILSLMELHGYPKKLGYDPWNSIELATRLEQRHGLTVAKMGQGYRLSVGYKAIEEAVEENLVRHSGDPVLRWMVDNVLIKSDDNKNIKIVKPDDHRKVDGVVSLSMAFNLWKSDDVQRTSVYELGGIKTQ